MKELLKIKELLGVKSDVGLALKLGMKNSRTIATWRNRNFIPPKVLEEWSYKFGKPIAWFTDNVPENSFQIPPPIGKIPIISLAQAGEKGFFEDSYPLGGGFGEINRPYDVLDEYAYALIVSGDSMIPRYEPGDLVVVSPAANVMTGDYVVAKLINDEVMLKKVKVKNAHYVLTHTVAV